MTYVYSSCFFLAFSAESEDRVASHGTSGGTALQGQDDTKGKRKTERFHDKTRYTPLLKAEMKCKNC